MPTGRESGAVLSGLVFQNGITEYLTDHLVDQVCRMNDSYTGMQISGTTGLTEAQRLSLRALGALTQG